MEELSGRLLLAEEITNETILNSKDIEIIQGILESKEKTECQRCLNTIRFSKYPCSKCNECKYCLECFQMGQIRSCSLLYHLPEINQFENIVEPIITWRGKLSKQQAKASIDIIYSIHHNERRLIWAVTGAGKTEMLFEGIAEALRLKKRVCIASPRIDVVRELAPRLQAAFKKVDISVLHGESEVDYVYTPLVLATTHQLLRFYQAFDVLIIDEIDAFPFYNNDLLMQVSDRARKEKSALIYLTATPDINLKKEVKDEKLRATILPARYHGNALSVPKIKFAGVWDKQLIEQPLNSPIIYLMKKYLRLGKSFLVFIPNIDWMLLFEKKLRVIFPENTFACVSSLDESRSQKIQAMRDGELDFLCTTTILERGVTFIDIQVIVIGAENRIYTEASLIQIAGRVGRHPEYATGEVTFFHFGKSSAMIRAVKQIKKMNQLATKRGLLHER